MILKKDYILNNNVKMPCLGIGTWLISKEDAKHNVYEALKMGYRLVDTAQAYKNEKEIGEGIKESKVDRNEIFITSKIAAEIKNYNEAKKSIDKSLEDLGVDYIDLMIIHCPQPWDEYNVSSNRYYKENIEVYRALEDAYKEGKLRAIGLSNFNHEDVKNIIDNVRIKPMVNQISISICNTPLELIKYCQDMNILVEAYCPIGHGALLKNQKILNMANKYNVTIPQLCLKYCLNLGLVAIPKTLNLEHMKNNSELDFEINVEDMEILKSY